MSNAHTSQRYFPSITSLPFSCFQTPGFLFWFPVRIPKFVIFLTKLPSTARCGVCSWTLGRIGGMTLTHRTMISIPMPGIPIVLHLSLPPRDMCLERLEPHHSMRRWKRYAPTWGWPRTRRRNFMTCWCRFKSSSPIRPRMLSVFLSFFPLSCHWAVHANAFDIWCCWAPKCFTMRLWAPRPGVTPTGLTRKRSSLVATTALSIISVKLMHSHWSWVYVLVLVYPR